MKLDDAIEEIGGFGFYQKWIFFLTCGLNLFSGFFMINPVFLLGVPLHRCAIPGYNNDTYAVQSEEHGTLINKYIPPSKLDNEDYDRCNYYVTDSNSSIVYKNKTLSTMRCDRWVYDKLVFESTFVSKVNLVCDKEIWVANTEMVFYGGMLVGSLASGILADRYGRKIVMYISVLAMIASSIGLAFAERYWLYVLLEFILGASVVANFMPAYIISLEFTSSKKRVWPGVISDFPYVFGLVLLAVIAYGLKDWFWIQLYTAAPTILFISYWWLMPESPRWLLAKGRVKEAETIVRTAAKWNKAKLPEKLFENISQDKEDKTPSFLSLFSTKTLFIRTAIIFFNWAAVAVGYYGLALNSDNLSGNVYLNFGLQGCVEVPGYLLVIFLVDRIGRRRLFAITMLVGGVACASTLFAIEFKAPGVDYIVITLAMIGKMCSTAAYGINFIHSAELFPTVLRNAGLGCASLFARIGTMVAPYVVLAGEDLGGSWAQALPLLVFGSLSIMSGLLSLFLPETLNKRLPETIDDGDKFGKSGAFYFGQSLHLHDDNSYEQIAEDVTESEHELLLSTPSKHPK